ncbi:MAG: lytic transglycosylase domain-containing protein [Aquabacterium sp.]
MSARLAAAAWLLGAAGACHAALWGFVDAQGVAHVANRPVDSRYQLVLGDRSTEPRVPGKTDASRALLTWMDIAPQVKSVQPWLREAARRHGVDTELLKAVIAVESGFDAKAVSPRGAIGLMQITAATADRYALPQEAQVPAEQRLLDPRTNILTGARMLADLIRRHGRIDVALAAWNAGEGTVRRHGGAVPPIDETRAHVHLTLELYWALLQHAQARGARELRVQP